MFLKNIFCRVFGNWASCPSLLRRIASGALKKGWNMTTRLISMS